MSHQDTVRKNHTFWLCKTSFHNPTTSVFYPTWLHSPIRLCTCFNPSHVPVTAPKSEIPSYDSNYRADTTHLRAILIKYSFICSCSNSFDKFLLYLPFFLWYIWIPNRFDHSWILITLKNSWPLLLFVTLKKHVWTFYWIIATIPVQPLLQYFLDQCKIALPLFYLSECILKLFIIHLLLIEINDLIYIYIDLLSYDINLTSIQINHIYIELLFYDIKLTSNCSFDFFIPFNGQFIHLILPFFFSYLYKF
jgi:hypothetical protein